MLKSSRRLSQIEKSTSASTAANDAQCPRTVPFYYPVMDELPTKMSYRCNPTPPSKQILPPATKKLPPIYNPSPPASTMLGWYLISKIFILNNASFILVLGNSVHRMKVGYNDSFSISIPVQPSESLNGIELVRWLKSLRTPCSRVLLTLHHGA